MGLTRRSSSLTGMVVRGRNEGDELLKSVLMFPLGNSRGSQPLGLLWKLSPVVDESARESQRAEPVSALDLANSLYYHYVVALCELMSCGQNEHHYLLMLSHLRPDKHHT